MKKILMYLVLLVSVAGLAQQLLFNLQDPAVGGAGNNKPPVDATTDEPVDPESAAGRESGGEAQDSDSAGNGESQDGEASAEESTNNVALDPEQADSDFEPTEEISEDYPVPLPSDI